MLLFAPWCLHQGGDRYPCMRRAGRNFYLNIGVFPHPTCSRMVGVAYVYGLEVPMWRMSPKGLEPYPKRGMHPMT